MESFIYCGLISYVEECQKLCLSACCIKRNLWNSTTIFFLVACLINKLYYRDFKMKRGDWLGWAWIGEVEFDDYGLGFGEIQGTLMQKLVSILWKLGMATMLLWIKNCKSHCWTTTNNSWSHLTFDSSVIPLFPCWLPWLLVRRNVQCSIMILACTIQAWDCGSCDVYTIYNMM